MSLSKLFGYCCYATRNSYQNVCMCQHAPTIMEHTFIRTDTRFFFQNCVISPYTYIFIHACMHKTQKQYSYILYLLCRRIRCSTSTYSNHRSHLSESAVWRYLRKGTIQIFTLHIYIKPAWHRMCSILLCMGSAVSDSANTAFKLP